MSAEPQSASEPILLRHDQGGVATLTLNRPSQFNSLSQALLGRLQDELDAIARDASIRVVVIKGAGRAFCAGHDLKEMRSNHDKAYMQALFRQCGRVMTTLTEMPQPVIARVHGIATAAGCQLVATCDLAVAAEDSRFATPGVNIGLFCSTPMVALSRNATPKQAMQMLLTGEAIDAPTALRFGLVNEIVPAAQLEFRTAALARQLASKSPLTLAIGKEAFYRQLELPLAEAYDYARRTMVENLQTLDAREGIAAFIDKRPPVWCGR